MFYEFDTIKHIKKFDKYGTVLFGTFWYEFFENSRESLYEESEKSEFFISISQKVRFLEKVPLKLLHLPVFIFIYFRYCISVCWESSV